MSDDLFAPIEEIAKNHKTPRKAIRYKKDDMEATLIIKHWYGSSDPYPITIEDISSKGLCITTVKELSINAKVILDLSIAKDYSVTTTAKVVRTYSATRYGLTFDKVQHQAIDYIVSDEADFTISLDH